MSRRPRRRFRLDRHGNLLFLRAAAGGSDGKRVVVRLLVDTGASYTILPVEVFESLGCDPRHPHRRVRIIAASGVISAPQLGVPWFHCLGRRVPGFPVVAHTLPPGAFFDGLLGMDFLARFKVVLDTARAEIGFREEG